jgi:hypothetical protein
MAPDPDIQTTSPAAPAPVETTQSTSAALLREHAEDRFNRGAVAAEQETGQRNRSILIIGGVIAAGAAVWLLLTM